MSPWDSLRCLIPSMSFITTLSVSSRYRRSGAIRDVEDRRLRLETLPGKILLLRLPRLSRSQSPSRAFSKSGSDAHEPELSYRPLRHNAVLGESPMHIVALQCTQFLTRDATKSEVSRFVATYLELAGLRSRGSSVNTGSVTSTCSALNVTGCCRHVETHTCFASRDKRE